MNKEDYFKYYIQGSDHYLISKDVFDELFDEMGNWREEAKELKKQLKQYQEEVCILDMRTDENIKYKNQQKEFINYLENEKDRLARECSHTYEDSSGKTRFVNEDIYKEVDTILRKYQEIIGDKE